MCSYSLYVIKLQASRILFTAREQLFYEKYVMLCAIWYNLYNLKNVKNTHGGVLLLMKLQALVCSFFTLSKLYKWYQFAHSISYCNGCFRNFRFFLKPLMCMFQNGQIHFKNLAENTAKFFKYVRQFWDIVH